MLDISVYIAFFLCIQLLDCFFVKIVVNTNGFISQGYAWGYAV